MSQSQKLRTPAIAAGRDFQELPAWQKAMNLAEQVFGLYEAKTDFTAQMRATALMIPSSIAAASGRNNEFGMTDSYSKAQSANAELLTQITLGQRLGYVEAETAAELLALVDEVARLIVGLKHGMKVAAKDKENAEKDAAHEERARKAERADRPRREYKPRGEGRPDREERQYKPRGEFSSRNGEDRPRREYKPRDSGSEDRPRREYKPRGEGSDRKPYGEKRGYGDKKPYSDKKPYGDKKSFGDRKPRGDKPFRKPRD